jgi:hypothetical protein
LLCVYTFLHQALLAALLPSFRLHPSQPSRVRLSVYLNFKIVKLSEPALSEDQGKCKDKKKNQHKSNRPLSIFVQYFVKLSMTITDKEPE